MPRTTFRTLTTLKPSFQASKQTFRLSSSSSDSNAAKFSEKSTSITTSTSTTTDATSDKQGQGQEQPKAPRKTQAQLDEELRLKMSGLAGDGGESGIEYEDGQPVAMKRSVKSNMFRYI
jgi:hypothetical protein